MAQTGTAISAETQRHARLIKIIAIGGLIVLASVVATEFYFGARTRTLLLAGFAALDLLISLALVQAGRVTLARYLLPTLGWLTANAIFLNIPVIHPHLFVVVNTVILLLAGALLDHRGILVFAAATIATSAIFAIAGARGLLNVHAEQGENWFTAGPTFALIIIFSYYGSRRRKQAADQAQQRAKETETLLQASHAVTLSLDMQDTIERILVQLERVVPYDSASVQILTDGSLEIVGGRGWDESAQVLGIQFPVPGDNPNTVVIETRQPYILNNAPESYEAFRQPPHNHIHSVLGVPLIIGDELIGMLSIDHRRPNFYQESHAHLAQAFADQVAIAIQNARHFQAEQRRRQVAAMQQDITQITSASLELDEVVQRVASLTCQAMEVDLSILILHRGSTGPLELAELHACSQALTPSQLDEFRQQLSRDLPADSIAHLAPDFGAKLLHVDDLPAAAPDLLHQWLEGGQGLLVPLIAAGRTTGYLVLLRLTAAPAFNSQEIEMALTISQSVATSIVNAQLYAQMERMAITDSLTDLYNRRGLIQLGEREIERARRFERPFSTLMLDLDHFKALNDSHGHMAGDDMLRQLAELLTQLVRSIDVVARYGGEEFAILLPECPQDCAQMVAERLRLAVENASFNTSAGPLTMTVSVGVASVSNLPLELERLLAAADRALYAAKEAGRNQCWSWYPQGPRPANP